MLACGVGHAQNESLRLGLARAEGCARSAARVCSPLPGRDEVPLGAFPSPILAPLCRRSRLVLVDVSAQVSLGVFILLWVERQWAVST